MTFDWIFFDCFNTLIDDFDQTGDDSGVSSMSDRVIKAGLYSNLEEFRQDYHQWRKAQWVNQWREISLSERLVSILQAKSPQTPSLEIASLVAEMVHSFEAHYPTTLRLPAGVSEMLDYWHGKVRMGVVSNFPLPHFPTRYLEQFELRPYFDFVLDSAACGWKKPGQEIYHAARQLAKMSESTVASILFIGDHLQNDVLVPMQLGMKTVYFDRSRDRPASAKAPDHVFAITHWNEFRLDSLKDLVK